MPQSTRRRPSGGAWDESLIQWLARSGVLASLVFAIVVPVAIGFAAAAILHVPRTLAIELALLGAVLALLLGFAAAQERSRRGKAMRGAQSIETIKALSWQDFERLVAGVYAKDGWAVTPTVSGADGGVDIIMTNAGVRAFVQCKRWRLRVVKVDAIRALYGVMAAEGVRQGIFVSAGRFTSEATRFAADCGIQCIGGEELLALLGRALPATVAYADEPTQLQPATAPSCPRCHETMVRRVGSRGAFWGCPRFPSCRGTRPL